MIAGRERILVADAGPDAATLAAALRRAGFDAVTAASGSEVLSRCARQPPTALLLDAGLPGLDGWEVLESLRCDPTTETLPVIMMTPAGDEVYVRQAFEAGATDFLTRPAEPTIIGHRVRFVLRASRLKRELRSAKTRATEANRAKLNFLANMSHELRTPLHAIIGLADLMRQQGEGMSGDQIVEQCRLIAESGEHLLAIVDDLLKLSQIQAGRFAMTEDTGDIAETVETARRLIASLAAQSEVSLTVDVAPDLPLVRADHRAIRQVLLNLLSNAVKFTGPGGAITVRVALNDAGGLGFSVSDNGVGMCAEDAIRVQRPFEQVDLSLRRAHGGAGLGLPLAASLIRQHGGEFAVESAPGEGATIKFTLPARRLVERSAHAIFA